jgi:hypothetical protein
MAEGTRFELVNPLIGVAFLAGRWYKPTHPTLYENSKSFIIEKPCQKNSISRTCGNAPMVVVE